MSQYSDRKRSVTGSLFCALRLQFTLRRRVFRRVFRGMVTGQFVVQLVKARDLLLILVLQRPWLAEVGLGFIKLLMQAHKALFVVVINFPMSFIALLMQLNTAGLALSPSSPCA